MLVVTRSRARMGCPFPSSTLQDGGRDDGTLETNVDLLHQRQHPLMNHVILSLLFEYITFRDLKTVRLVCKKWNVNSIPFAHSRFRVHVCKSGITTPYGRGVGGRPRGLENFVKVLRSNKLGIPFARFRPSPFDTTEGIGREFLQLCGSTFKEIDLRWNCRKEVERRSFSVEDISNLLKSAPRLESFYMADYINSKSGEVVRLFPGERPRFPCLKKLFLGFLIDSVQRRKCCPTFFEELLSTAANISSLYFLDIKWEWQVKACSLDVLEVLEKYGNVSCIETLYLTGNTTVEHVEVLGKMVKKQNGLNLKTLHFLTVAVARQDYDGFHMIELFKDTLVSLDLGMGFNCMDLRGFPKMSKLKKLKLLISNDSILNFANFKNSFPALEILTVKTIEMVHELYDFLSWMVAPCPKITKLVLHDGVQLMTTLAFSCTISFFPNLKELQLEVKTVEILKKMFCRATQVEVLVIWGCLPTGGNLDALFTGIYARDINRIGDPIEYAKLLAELTVETRRAKILKLTNERRSRKSPSIADLTNLKDLTLDIVGTAVGGRGRCNALSGMTGILGLYSLEKLKNLDIRRCVLSKTSCEILVADMGLEVWNFTGADRKKIIPSRK